MQPLEAGYTLAVEPHHHHTEIANDKNQRLEDKIAALKKEMARLKKLEVRMLATPD